MFASALAFAIIFVMFSGRRLLEAGPLPVAPKPAHINPYLLLGSGQSNMLNMQVYGFFSAQGMSFYGFADGNTPISCWELGQRCWSTLFSQIASRDTAKAFAWAQGETDDVLIENACRGRSGCVTAMRAEYVAALSDLVKRVRAVVGRPNLPIYVTKLNPQFVNINPALVTVATTLADVTLIDTDHPHWWAPDMIHLNNFGAASLVATYKSQ